MQTLSFSNGELQVILDDKGLVKDLFFPHVGSELQTTDIKHRIGVFIGGEISWLDDGNWRPKYRWQYGADIGQITLVNYRLGILLEFEDFVVADKNAFLRNIHVVNLWNSPRQLYLFLHQSFDINARYVADTAEYLEDDKLVLHHNGRRAFAITSATSDGACFDQHSVGLFGGDLAGTWLDGQDGELENTRRAVGLTDSTIRQPVEVAGLSSQRVHYYLVAATSIKQAIELSHKIRQTGFLKQLEITTDWWHKWLKPVYKILPDIAPQQRQILTQSAVFLKSQIDRRGAVIFNQENEVGYSSPRQSATVLLSLIRLGYRDEAINFFNFCLHGLTKQGYLYPVYRGDQAVGVFDPPSDNSPLFYAADTASALFVFTQYAILYKTPNILDDFYQKLAVPMANFTSDQVAPLLLNLDNYQNNNSDLYDFDHLLSLAYVGLLSVADLADMQNDQNNAVKWRTVAEDIYQFAKNSVYQDHATRNLSVRGFFNLIMSELIDPKHPIIEQTIEDFRNEALNNKSALFNKRNSTEVDYVGNLQLAQYYFATNQKAAGEEIVEAVIDDLASGKIATEKQTIIRAELISTLLDK